METQRSIDTLLAILSEQIVDATAARTRRGRRLSNEFSLLLAWPP